MARAEAASAPTFGDRVADAVDSKRSQVVLGIDPRPDLFPVEVGGDVSRFCCGLIDAVAPHVVAVKPQLAFFEALGVDGVAAFEEICGYARAAGLLVIVDGKRGDIGSTGRAYAAAYLEPRGEDAAPLADALTVNPYLGRDSVDPYLASCRRHGGGIFCVVKTSNPGGAEVQDLALSDGAPVWHHVGLLVADWAAQLVGDRGLSSVGAVIGATHPRAVAEARRILPQSVLLLPGVGAQGAKAADVARAFTSGPASALVPVARSVMYAYRTTGAADWRAAAGAEAARVKSEVWTASGW